MSLSDAYNFIQIDGRTATAGQPTEEQFRDAAAAGYEAVINLAPDGLETSLANEAELLAALGIEYHHIPVPWTEPRLDHLAAFETAMESVGERKALVHCQANYRVTAFYALYAQARLGWIAEQADALIDRIWKSNPDYRMDAAWSDFIAEARARGD